MPSSTDNAAGLVSLLHDHARVAWDGAAQALLASSPVRIVPFGALDRAPAGLVVMGDRAFYPDAPVAWANCFGRNLPMLDLFDLADFPGFAPVPGHDWLWRSQTGALMPAFNLAGAVRHLLAFGDEAGTAVRDRHGRLPPEASLLGRKDLLHLPVVNIWLFALLAAAKGLAEKKTGPSDPEGHVLPPALFLSHDCDQLVGNDLHTQLARMGRFVSPLRRRRLPDWAQLTHILDNARHPRRYFFEDALRMLAAEDRAGLRSAFYFLTGARGRYGARSGEDLIGEFSAHIPAECEIGIHYNYRTARNAHALEAQKAAIERATGRRVRSGRAHYLTLDPRSDFASLARAGITSDETLGFAERSGFRLGYAGAYRVGGDGGPGVVAVPLQFMDTNMAASLLDTEVFPMMQAVEQVGGAVTILFHPGSYASPEAPALHGVYDRCLDYFARRGYRSYLPGDVSDLLFGKARTLRDAAA